METMTRGPDPKIEPIKVLGMMIWSSDPAFTTSEVAEQFDATVNGARYQMDRMVERGYLKKKKSSHRTTIYWPTQEGRQAYVDANQG